jgi:hypothetical protein
MRTSPFNKQELNKDIHFLAKKSKEAATNVHDVITSIFPIAGEVPHSIRIYSAVFYLLVVCAAFAYLFVTGYRAALGAQFLIPYSGNNASPDENCKLVPISYTGNFLLTEDGHWEGSKKFSYNLATYNLAMTSYSSTSKGFRNDMESVFQKLQYYGDIVRNQPLDSNLLLWMSLVFVNQSSNAKRLTLTGDPLIIFDRDHTDAAVSSIFGNCNVSSVSSFDSATGTMSVSFVYADFIAEPKCVKAMNPIYFGYNTLAKPTLFELSFDIRSIISGIAVNVGILRLEQLQEITKYRQDYMLGAQRVVARYFYDPRYDGMKSIRCVTLDGGKPFCTFRINDVS